MIRMAQLDARHASLRGGRPAADPPLSAATLAQRGQRRRLRLFEHRAPSLFQRCLALHIALASETRWRAIDPPAHDS